MGNETTPTPDVETTADTADTVSGPTVADLAEAMAMLGEKITWYSESEARRFAGLLRGEQ